MLNMTDDQRLRYNINRSSLFTENFTCPNSEGATPYEIFGLYHNWLLHVRGYATVRNGVFYSRVLAKLNQSIVDVFRKRRVLS